MNTVILESIEEINTLIRDHIYEIEFSNKNRVIVANTIYCMEGESKYYPDVYNIWLDWVLETKDPSFINTLEAHAVALNSVVQFNNIKVMCKLQPDLTKDDVKYINNTITKMADVGAVLKEYKVNEGDDNNV